MEKIKNLSLRKTIILYTVASLVCTFLLSAVIFKTAEHTQKQIFWKYADEEAYFEIAEKEGLHYSVNIQRPDSQIMTQTDLFLYELCDFLQTYTILILSVTGCCGAVLFFYKSKLKKPLKELERASKNISENNLDFQITYKNKDEMGHLCHEFERMREQLAKNNQKLWRMIEEEKTLRAAIAHDIRSPLAIMKGYQEMLIEYLPDETIDMDKAVHMLTAGMAQLERMDHFVETMQKLSSLENRELSREEITARQLAADMQAELTIFEKASAKQCVLQAPETEEVFFGDKAVILEVTENLLSNALRYAKEKVHICIQLTALELKIRVHDDGTGFGENAEEMTKAFRQQNAKDSLNHTGLGMYISRLYCEKHGGHLLLENNENNGASVTAVFSRIV